MTLEPKMSNVVALPRSEDTELARYREWTEKVADLCEEISRGNLEARI